LVFLVQQDEGGGHDRPDTPRAEADPAKGFEGGLE
jgi:hypothetical protein